VRKRAEIIMDKAEHDWEFPAQMAEDDYRREIKMQEEEIAALHGRISDLEQPSRALTPRKPATFSDRVAPLESPRMQHLVFSSN
jgi:hypothetical protein